MLATDTPLVVILTSSLSSRWRTKTTVESLEPGNTYQPVDKTWSEVFRRRQCYARVADQSSCTVQYSGGQRERHGQSRP
jgi:hypothetical protein